MINFLFFITLFYGIFSWTNGNAQNNTTNLPITIQYKLGLFFTSHNITYHDIKQHSTLTTKLHKSGCHVLKDSAQKIVFKLPAPYTIPYVIKINCSDDSKARNCSRVFLANDIQIIITKNKFQHVFVPKKHLYRMPNAPKELNDENYIVLAEEHDLDKHHLFFHASDKALQEIMYIMCHFYCFDQGYYIDTNDKIIVHDYNICLTLNGNIYFIDTDGKSIINTINDDVDILFEEIELFGWQGQFPQEILLAYHLLKEKDHTYNYLLQEQAKLLLQNIYTCFCGLYPIFKIRNNIAKPYINYLLSNIKSIESDIKNSYPEIFYNYQQSIHDYKSTLTYDLASTQNIITTQWYNLLAQEQSLAQNMESFLPIPLPD